MTLRACIKSFRLRTLPLSLSGVAAGVCAATAICDTPAPGTALVFLTAALLQILSNLSNELGDTLNGTDGEDRQGIRYSLQEGDMEIADMKRLIACTASACCASGLAMVFLSFGTLLAAEPLLLIALGAAAIWAAVKYTLGKNPYGYRGLGDIFVFIFFGPVSCCGACYIGAHALGLQAVMKASLLPACAIGLFSVGVLNVNNIRDAATDAATRTTVAIQLGEHRARIYQSALIAAGWLLMILSVFVRDFGKSAAAWLFMLTLPLYILHLKGVWTKKGKALDPMLPLLVMSTFALAVLAGLGMLVR